MGAVISACGAYRYRLTRPSETLSPDRGSALFVMLNPSIADADLDDPTIRRCRGFARTWGCAGLAVANLYALRSTDPTALWLHADPVGPENDEHLSSLAREFGDVVCAWGAHARPERVAAVYDLLRAAGARTWCLGTTRGGAPRHPLYMRRDAQLIPWSPSSAEGEEVGRG